MNRGTDTQGSRDQDMIRDENKNKTAPTNTTNAENQGVSKNITSIMQRKKQKKEKETRKTKQQTNTEQTNQ